MELTPVIIDAAADSSIPNGLDNLPRIVSTALRRHCRRFRCSPDDRLDLAQDAYIASLTAHSSFNPSAGASHNTWVTRRVQGQLLDSTRKLRGRGMTHLPPDLHHTAPIVDASSDDSTAPAWESEIAADQDDAGDSLALAESQDAVALLAREMRPNEFHLLALHYGLAGHEPHSLREIAEGMGVAYQAVHQRLQRLLRLAKGILQQADRHSATH